MTCLACGGPLILLGQLGRRTHLRCRNCGLDQSTDELPADPRRRDLVILPDFKLGERVQTHPATDAWVFGDRYGDVVKITPTYVHVKMDRSGRTLKFHPHNLQRVYV